MQEGRFISSEVSLGSLENVSGGYRPGGYFNPNTSTATVFRTSPQAVPQATQQQQQQGGGFNWGGLVSGVVGGLLHNGGSGGLLGSLGSLVGGLFK